MSALRIYVPGDAAAAACGADELAAAITVLAAKRKQPVEIVRNGSRGMHWLEPMLEVVTPQGRIAYGPVEAADLDSVFDAMIAGGTAHKLRIGIGETKVSPLCSTYFNVIGEEIDWSEITVLFAGAGQDWDGASFFPLVGPDGGPLDNPNARLKLRELETRLDDDRLVLNEGNFFDKWGRRMKIEEIAVQ